MVWTPDSRICRTALSVSSGTPSTGISRNRISGKRKSSPLFTASLHSEAMLPPMPARSNIISTWSTPIVPMPTSILWIMAHRSVTDILLARATSRRISLAADGLTRMPTRVMETANCLCPTETQGNLLLCLRLYLRRTPFSEIACQSCGENAPW